MFYSVIWLCWLGDMRRETRKNRLQLYYCIHPNIVFWGNSRKQGWLKKNLLCIRVCRVLYNMKWSWRPGKLCMCLCLCLGCVHGTNCYVRARQWGTLLEQLFNSWDLWGGLCCCQRRHNYQQWRLVVMLVCSSNLRPTYVFLAVSLLRATWLNMYCELRKLWQLWFYSEITSHFCALGLWSFSLLTHLGLSQSRQPR